MEHAHTSLRRTTANRGNLPRLGGAAETRRDKPRLLRHARAVRRVATVLLVLPFAMAVQGVLLLHPGREKVAFARFFWSSVARIIGLHVRVIGMPAGGRRTAAERQTMNAAARPVIYVCNHSSWLDIPAVGGQENGRFVAKDDVASWPIISLVARLGRTVFVSRNRGSTLKERDEMQATLAGGDDLFLFPEGTSSDGSRVLPFRSSFFAAAYGRAVPLVQPVSIVYDRLSGLPVTHASRGVFSWYGDMTLAPHVWQVAQWRGKRVSLLFHPPLDPAAFPDRKALAQATWQAVADGAAALRQNRSVQPAKASAEIVAIGSAEAAFA
jgi:1-acyl-sn-glycerol-3-phosphate acyltransferase